MSARSPMSSRSLLIVVGVLLLVSIVIIFWCFTRHPPSPQKARRDSRFDATPQAQDLPPNHQRLTVLGAAFQVNGFQVAIGNEEEARKYYKETVSPQLHFLAPETIENSTIKELLTYFGYTNVSASDLHRLSSDDLMRLADDGDILATRFFAPKITEVTTKPKPIPEHLGFGWRKLVRLKARPSSEAIANGMSMLVFLQNIFEKTVEGNPFNADKNVSKFNQAIVVRKEGPFTADKQPAYFFAYSTLVKLNAGGQPIKDADGNFENEGKLAFSLKATFDEVARDPETSVRISEYFIPRSCRDCHGGQVAIRAKLNFLDTDHWIDRVTPNYGLTDARFKEEDFTSLAVSPSQVIFDGGKDPATIQKAFDVIRRLNEEFRDQNKNISGGNNFQLKAVERWLDLHRPERFGNNHAPPYERGFGDLLWDPNSESDKKTLYYLNRYCYRCHSSVKYNVFDKKAVVDRLASIRDRVTDVSTPDFWMPQDRMFPGLKIDPSGQPQVTDNLKEFFDLLDLLQP